MKLLASVSMADKAPRYEVTQSAELHLVEAINLASKAGLQCLGGCLEAVQCSMLA